MIKDRDRAYKNAHKTHCPLDHAHYRALLSAISNKLVTLKNKYKSARLLYFSQTLPLLGSTRIFSRDIEQ